MFTMKTWNHYEAQAAGIARTTDAAEG